ncbi:Stk1 family PASTA domain-containing Ser/Thr kinase [Thermohalobacter berrensis]|uniref:non-specific serine/threonine protein kinase n=1 Tax=Thermohalobacter berrensis TaxID=99594 RepID=A0A419TA86_9FIRM|nr:Stk1 family PASTA domain-containing Ser/Thr kinase [Thermohalobacter berrensis]RKD34367.1 serine/threonine protein kinase [Thermohalobacter berrensis]
MIGKILGDRYEIIERIGGGGMALVYKAKCRLLNRYVAIKVLRTEFTNDDEFINKFKRESQAAASLCHPNIVNIYDVGVEDNIHYIVMEYVKGKTLKQLIREKGKLSYEETLDIATQITEAINHAHKNHIVHRDIKPHNILITDDGRVKVTDFGIARAATSTTVTNTSNVIGSVHYFSPEQARGGYTDEKSDIYSLGIVMYEMITGRVPYQGESPISIALKHIQEDIIPPREIDKSIPKSIEKIILKCVEKNQSLRYESAGEVLKDLQKAKSSSDGDFVEFKNLDDSPTRVMPAIKDEKIDKKKQSSRKNKKSEKKEKGKKSNYITAIAIVLAFLITSGLAVGFIVVKDYLFTEEVVMPQIVGMHEDKAREKIESLGLEFKVKGRRYDDTYKEGVVISQSEEPGYKVVVGYPIEVYVSKGPKTVEVPNLTNKYYSDVEIVLNNAGLKMGEVVFENSEIPTDIVIEQNPKPNQKVPEGTKVDIVVSEGPEISYIIMPKLIGLDIEKAKKEIISKGFSIGEIKYEYNDEFDKNVVVWQSYPAGTEIEENTSIDLIVSNGTQISNDEEDQNGQDNVNTDNDSTNTTESENGDKEKNEEENKETALHINIPLPQNKDEVEVKIYKIQDGIKELIYSKVHETKEEWIAVTVSGKGKAKFAIYFDGELYKEKEISF